MVKSGESRIASPAISGGRRLICKTINGWSSARTSSLSSPASSARWRTFNAFDIFRSLTDSAASAAASLALDAAR
jgi:hypothetical protein